MINILTVIKVVSVKSPIDSYMNGYCMRCGRKREDCERLRLATGKRCTELPLAW